MTNPLKFTTDDRLDALAIIRAWAQKDAAALAAINSNAGPNMHLALIDTAATLAQGLAEASGTNLDQFLDSAIQSFTTPTENTGDTE